MQLSVKKLSAFLALLFAVLGTASVTPAWSAPVRAQAAVVVPAAMVGRWSGTIGDDAGELTITADGSATLTNLGTGESGPAALQKSGSDYYVSGAPTGGYALKIVIDATGNQMQLLLNGYALGSLRKVSAR